MGRRSTFGNVEKLPSGLFRVRYTGPDAHLHELRRADGKGLRFQTRADAAGALAREHTKVLEGGWKPQPVKAKAELFGAYSTAWVTTRPLSSRTADLYRSLLANHIGPTFDAIPLSEITPVSVREWHAGLGKAKPRAAANAYALLKAILNTAVSDDAISANPCRVTGGGSYRRAKEPAQATLEELAELREKMPEHYRAAIDLGVWCSLRIGEVIGLQRADVDLNTKVVKVRRSVGRARSGREEKLPKSAAGIREVFVPPHIVGALQHHLNSYTGAGRKAWVFPAGTDATLNVSGDVLREAFQAARKRIGREDLTFHALRGIGATLAARAGATVAELQHRLGHATPNMALAYQRVAHERPRQIAERLSALATADDPF